MATKKSKAKWEPTPMSLIDKETQEQIGNYEDEAKELVEGWTECVGKLEEFYKPIMSVQSSFNQLRKWGFKVKILGCKNFQEFCRVKLHRSEQAIYTMLAKRRKAGAPVEYKQTRVVGSAVNTIIRAAILIHKKDRLAWQAIVELLLAAVATKASEVKGAQFIKGRAKGATA
jgi:hypothetical protein